MQDVEGVLLTGGRSSRMGRDKALLPVSGVPMGLLIASRLAEAANPVTVVGREPMAGYGFIQDVEEFGGPLVALSLVQPKKPLVFVSSCDLARFDPSVVQDLLTALGAREAAVPVVGGKAQPLCALYRSEALLKAREAVSRGERRMMAWLDSLDRELVPSETLRVPHAVRSANTPAELRSLENEDGPDL